MFLGIDIGTGSSKAVLAKADGTVVARSSVAHKMSMPRPGWAEFDAEATWWGEVRTLSRELLENRDPSDLEGICISGLGPCLVLTDDDLVPQRRAILYGVDSRAGKEIEALELELGKRAIFDASGKDLSSQAVGPKLRWVRDQEPNAFHSATKMFSAHSYLVAKLTGEYVLDHHTASQYAPMYDVHKFQWHDEWAQLIAEHIELPRLAWSTEVVGAVTPAAEELTGIPAGTPVVAGTVDAWAEAFSAGVRNEGDLMVMYGSTIFFVQILDSYRADPMLWTTAGVGPQTLTLAAGTSTGGSLTTWAQELFGETEFEDLVAEAEDVPPGSNGLLVLPYFAGERTPIFDPHARGAFIGLTLRHNRGHVFRAVYEGIAFSIRHILESFDTNETPIRRMVAVGGGTQSRIWLQTVSDVTGYEQVVPKESIGASYGDALMAAIGTGHVAADTDWASIGEVIKPDPGRKDIYDKLYAQYIGAYPLLKNQMHALADIEEHGVGA